jgi:hypothetical protein
VAVVLDDGVEPSNWQALSLAEARDFAAATVAVTHGKVHEIDETGPGVAKA